MSLPSGLIFFLDFRFEGISGTANRLGFNQNTSLYGGNVVGAELTGGVDLAGTDGTVAGQFYNLTNGYSSPTASVVPTDTSVCNTELSGVIGDNGTVALEGWNAGDQPAGSVVAGWTAAQINARILRHDPDLTSGSSFVVVALDLTGSKFNFDDLAAINFVPADAAPTEGANQDAHIIKRLARLSSSADGVTTSQTKVQVLIISTGSTVSLTVDQAEDVNSNYEFPIADDFIAGGAVGAVVGDPTWGLEGTDDIPEINLKVDSVSVTAMTKKLKAKWTPELGQDLNAYHNLDAEVELTSLLSEQIALEIDREILEDLVKGAKAATYYWSRSPGLFLNKSTGVEVGAGAAAPDFTGTVSEWYETLGETINDVSAQIHRKTLRGGANFLVTSPEVANILEFTAGFRANVTVDDAKGTAGSQNVGSLSKRYDVWVDPYFPRNLVLIGRKGNSFLESGYVYAPYVPLQVTPTIFGVEDFVPRKGVMTRYAKKMVRPDMYGLVIVRGLLGETGSS
jgi:hypothetical protein